MKQFNLAEWALNTSPLSTTSWLCSSPSVFSHLPIWDAWKILIYDAHHGGRCCLAGASPQEMSNQVTDKLEEKTTRPSWCRLYKIFHRWQQIRYLYQSKRGFAIR